MSNTCDAVSCVTLIFVVRDVNFYFVEWINDVLTDITKKRCNEKKFFAITSVDFIALNHLLVF